MTDRLPFEPPGGIVDVIDANDVISARKTTLFPHDHRPGRARRVRPYPTFSVSRILISD